MSGFLTLDAREFDRLVEVAGRWRQGSERAINEVLHGEGARLIGQSIDSLVPESGRTFKGHTSGARGSAWQKFVTNQNVAVTVTTKSSRHYLYFPDDGTNTKRHAGEKHFFLQGAEEASESVVDLCIERIIERMEG